MKILTKVCIGILILITTIAKSQIYFQNKTNEPVCVALCMYYDSKDSKYWGSHGWWTVEPGDKVAISDAIGFEQNIYYYAYSTTSDKKYEGDVNLLVHPTNAFFIKNADKDYNIKEHSEYEWRKFRHVVMNESLLQLKYTITLEY